MNLSTARGLVAPPHRRRRLRVAASSCARGATFVGVALVGALLLAAVASSAPLARVWRNARRPPGPVGQRDQPDRGRGHRAGAGSQRPVHARVRPSADSGNRPRRSSSVASSDGRGYLLARRGLRRSTGTPGSSSMGAASRRERSPLGSPIPDDRRSTARRPGRRELIRRPSPRPSAAGTAVAPGRRCPLDQDARSDQRRLRPASRDQAAWTASRTDEPTRSAPLVRVEAGATAPHRQRARRAGTDYPDWVAATWSIQPAAADRSSHDTADRSSPARSDQRVRTTSPPRSRPTSTRPAASSTRPTSAACAAASGWSIASCEEARLLRVLRDRDGDDAPHPGHPGATGVGYLPGQKLDTGPGRSTRRGPCLGRGLLPGFGWVRFDPTPGNRENGQRATTFARGDPEPTTGSNGPADDAELRGNGSG